MIPNLVSKLLRWAQVKSSFTKLLSPVFCKKQTNESLARSSGKFKTNVPSMQMLLLILAENICLVSKKVPNMRGSSLKFLEETLYALRRRSFKAPDLKGTSRHVWTELLNQSRLL